jgi:CBS domain-containing protein
MKVEVMGLDQTFEREMTRLDRALGTVKDAMTREVVTVTPQMKASEALRRLEAAKVSGVPVVEHGRVVGIFSISDLLGQAGAPWQIDGPAPRREPTLADVEVGELMSRDVVTADPEWTLTQAATVMEAVFVNRLPVVDALDRPIGILTRDDIVRAVARRAQLAARVGFGPGSDQENRIIEIP